MKTLKAILIVVNSLFIYSLFMGAFFAFIKTFGLDTWMYDHWIILGIVMFSIGMNAWAFIHKLWGETK